MIAADYTRRIAPSTLHAAGITEVSRYLSWLPNPKVIGKTEFQELGADSITCRLNWEFDAKDWLGGRAKAKQQAAEAIRQAEDIGYSYGSPLTGSADFDMTATQWNSAGAFYADQWRTDVTNAGFTPGVYSAWDVLSWCEGIGGFGFLWQSMSTSFSQNRNRNPYPNAHWIQHFPQLTVGGVSIDQSTIRKEPTVALNQSDADLIVNTLLNKIVGGKLHQQPFGTYVTDACDMIVRAGSSYDGRFYGSLRNIVDDVETIKSALNAAPVDEKALAADIAAALVASNTNGLTDGDNAAIRADVESVLANARLSFGS